MIRQVQTKIKYEVSDLDDLIKQDISTIMQRIDKLSDKIEDLVKQQSDKKTILNIPTTFDDPKNKGKMDEDFIVEALEKMRDYIAQENKRMKDEMFKLRLEFETKVREKLDKKDLEDIESKSIPAITTCRTNDGKRRAIY